MTLSVLASKNKEPVFDRRALERYDYTRQDGSRIDPLGDEMPFDNAYYDARLDIEWSNSNAIVTLRALGIEIDGGQFSAPLPDFKARVSTWCFEHHFHLSPEAVARAAAAEVGLMTELDLDWRLARAGYRAHQMARLAVFIRMAEVCGADTIYGA